MGLSQEAMEELESLRLRPKMYVTTPEAADAVATVLAALVIRGDTVRSLTACQREVYKIVREIMYDDKRLPSIAPLLCDESPLSPSPTSFEAFSKNTKLLLSRLKPSE